MVRDPRTPDCGIKGCKRAAHRGQLCRAHYQLVPHEMKVGAMIAVMRASHFTAKREHRKQLAYVRALESSIAPASTSGPT